MFTSTSILALSLALIAGQQARPVRADSAITAPSNGSTISGGNVDFRWYSDDGDDARQFDIGLMSLTPLGEYTVGADRIVSESVLLPANLPEGEYYLAVNEIDDSDTDGSDRGIDDYDVRFQTEGSPPGARSQPAVLTVTTALSSTRKRTLQPRLQTPGPARRQQGTTGGNNNDDEILYSPGNSTVSAGSSFNFTYRVDDTETDRVLVGLIKAYTGLQGTARPTSTSERTVFEGSIAVPSDIVPGQYYLAVFSDENDETIEVGEYDLTFSTNARNDVEITGEERPILVTVDNPNYTGGSISPSSSSAATSASTGATQSAGTGSSTVGGGNAVQSSTAALSTPSSGAMGGSRGSVVGGAVGGLVAWAFL